MCKEWNRRLGEILLGFFVDHLPTEEGHRPRSRSNDDGSSADQRQMGQGNVLVDAIPVLSVAKSEDKRASSDMQNQSTLGSQKSKRSISVASSSMRSLRILPIAVKTLPAIVFAENAPPFVVQKTPSIR